MRNTSKILRSHLNGEIKDLTSKLYQIFGVTAGQTDCMTILTRGLHKFPSPVRNTKPRENFNLPQLIIIMTDDGTYSIKLTSDVQLEAIRTNGYTNVSSCSCIFVKHNRFESFVMVNSADEFPNVCRETVPRTKSGSTESMFTETQSSMRNS